MTPVLEAPVGPALAAVPARSAPHSSDPVRSVRTLETFFEKFALFADAPDAIAKIRKLVLQLAVQGRLVEAKASDGIASEIFNGELPVKGTLRYEVAENWIWVRFASVGDQRLGKMLDQRGNRGALKPYLRNTNVQWMRFELDDIKELRLEPDELEEYRLLPGDLLICEGGEPGRCAIWRNPDREMYFQKAIHRVRPRKGILSEYLAICLQVDAQNGVLAEHFTGATIKHFTGRSLSEYSIPLPPLAEQKRIVAKVDELMALCDRLEAQQQERETRHAALARASLARFAEAPIRANLHLLFHPSYPIPPADLGKSILTLAVQGKLVPQDSDDTPAANLLAQIARLKQAMIEAKQVRQGKVSRPHSALDAPTELPPHWEWVNVDSLCFKVTDGTHFTPQYTASGVRFVSAKDIVSGRLVFDRCKFITEEEHRQLYRRCNPQYHDIVISKSSSIGTVALIEDHGEFSLFESLALLKFDQSSLFPDFLVYALTHACASLTAGHIRGVGVKHLHLDILRGLEIALPPLAEQRRIVAKVDQLMALVDQLESQLAASRATAANLLEALVAELTSAPRPQPALVTPRPATKAQPYLIRFIPALLRAVGQPLSLERLNSAVAFIFLPTDQLLPLVERLSGPAARAHFASFTQPYEDGAFLSAVQMLIRIRTLSHTTSPSGGITLALTGKLPPLTPEIEADAHHLAPLVALIPPESIAAPLARLQPARVREAVLMPT